MALDKQSQWWILQTCMTVAQPGMSQGMQASIKFWHFDAWDKLTIEVFECPYLLRFGFSMGLNFSRGQSYVQNFLIC